MSRLAQPHPHSSVTPAHDSTGVGWVFTPISTTREREKGERMTVPMQAGADYYLFM